MSLALKGKNFQSKTDYNEMAKMYFIWLNRGHVKNCKINLYVLIFIE